MAAGRRSGPAEGVEAAGLASRPILPAARSGPRDPGAVARTGGVQPAGRAPARAGPPGRGPDRKSTRLNSSHGSISYAVFCLKKKKKKIKKQNNKKKKRNKNEIKKKEKKN